MFVSGAVVMILELAGSRIIAPFFGTSLPVWTAIIGVILGSLSAGYLAGGKLADKKADYLILAKVLFGAGLLIGILAFTDELVLLWIQLSADDLRVRALVSSIILLAPASVVLGMISPYAIRLRIDSVATSGTTVGSLYALSTVGSIFGTFLAGFFLISFLGTFKIIIALSLAMFLLSLLADRKHFLVFRVAAILLVFLVLAGLTDSQKFAGQKGFADIDTAYNRIWVLDDYDPSTGRLVRRLMVNGENDSSMFLEDGDLVHDYTKFYRLVGHFRPDTAKALMIGGGAYSYPRDYLKNFPDAAMDVVEIDPGITGVAQNYFGLSEDPRMKIIHEDGRAFLNDTDESYDAIFLDAYKSFSVPFHLTTLEAVEKMYERLDEKGVVLANVISSVTGDSGKFLRAQYRTFSEVFPFVYVFPVGTDGSVLQNVMLVAAKSVPTASFKSPNKELQTYLNNLWKEPISPDVPVLTDDFAPVEQYMSQAINY